MSDQKRRERIIADIEKKAGLVRYVTPGPLAIDLALGTAADWIIKLQDALRAIAVGARTDWVYQDYGDPDYGLADD